MDNKGTHCILDAYLAYWPGDNAVYTNCVAALEACGMEVVEQTHYAFEPAGLTAVWILAESHFTLHTYPEHKYISVDCYTCGAGGRAFECITALLASFGANIAASNTQLIARGRVA